MTVTTDYADLHRLVDRLTPVQATALRMVAQELVAAGPTDGPPPAPPIEPPAKHRFSFIGIMDAAPDLAARSAQILRDELGRPSEDRPAA
jgi:hypothetical protein